MIIMLMLQIFFQLRARDLAEDLNKLSFDLMHHLMDFC